MPRRLGQSTIELVIWVAVCLTALLALRTPLQRTLGGHWRQAFSSGQAPYVSGKTTGKTTRRMSLDRTDEFTAMEASPGGSKKVLSAIRSVIRADTSHEDRQETVQVSP